tara:strand:- start:604 stop:2361 length:1758 start_codon:yes stop_codon:yes gene_type:complete
MVLGKTGRVCRRQFSAPTFISWGFFFNFIAMCFRFVFLFFYCFSFAQDFIDLDSLHFKSLFYQSPNIKLNNIGDPIIFLVPIEDDDFYLDHYSSKVRNVDFFKQNYLHPHDSIYSFISYQKTYSEGGLVETFLSRPIGPNIKLNFSYNNLNSVGFYVNQENKYSVIDASVLYHSKNNPYSFNLSFFSNNGFYNQNGGLSNYNTDLSSDLQITYLNSAQTIIKKRILQFDQHYLINDKLKLKHHFLINNFERSYIDLNPQSYHYSLTPFDFSLEGSYEHFTFFQRYANSISINNINFVLSVNHNYYNTNDIILNELGDLDITISTTDSFDFKNNIYFKLGFFPAGYNKHNYFIDLKLKKKLNAFDNNLRFLFLSKKPDFFSKQYYTGGDFNWHNFLSSRVASFSFSSTLIDRNFFFSATFNHYVNYLYFNTVASPLQSTDEILYYNFRINKKWVFNNLTFNSILYFQKSNNEVLSVPSLLFKQQLKYDCYVFKDIRLLSSYSFLIFSNYYINNYYPLTDVFYHNLNEKKGLIPFSSAEIHLYKENFSLGFIFDDLTNFFYEGNYLIKDYVLPQPSLRLAVRWSFID